MNTVTPSSELDRPAADTGSAPSPFRVAAVQMASGPNVEGNLQEAARLIEIAVEKGARLVALPEYFAIMGMKDTDKVALREKEGKGPIQDFLVGHRETARNLDGRRDSVPLESSRPDKVRNSMLVLRRHGHRSRATTRSICSASKWGRRATPRSAPSSRATRSWPSTRRSAASGFRSATTCAFPSCTARWATSTSSWCPSAFTETTGKAHWETLIRARAIENLAYVLAPAQGGYHVNGRETHGNSMIVDPWGVVLDRLPRGSGVVVAGVNPSLSGETADKPAGARPPTLFRSADARAPSVRGVSAALLRGTNVHTETRPTHQLNTLQTAANARCSRRTRSTTPDSSACSGTSSRTGRLRRPLLPVQPLRGLEPGGGHRQVRQLQHRPGRGRARGERREDRLRLLRRHQPAGARSPRPKPRARSRRKAAVRGRRR